MEQHTTIKKVFEELASQYNSTLDEISELLYPFSWRDTPPAALLAQLYCLGPIGQKLVKAVKALKKIHGFA